MGVLFDVLGWTGTVMMIVAYALVSNGKIKSESSIYQHLNLWGALGLGASVFYKQAWPAFCLELVWAGIALAALCSHRRKSKE